MISFLEYYNATDLNIGFPISEHQKCKDYYNILLYEDKTLEESPETDLATHHIANNMFEILIRKITRYNKLDFLQDDDLNIKITPWERSSWGSKNTTSEIFVPDYTDPIYKQIPKMFEQEQISKIIKTLKNNKQIFVHELIHILNYKFNRIPKHNEYDPTVMSQKEFRKYGKSSYEYDSYFNQIFSEIQSKIDSNEDPDLANKLLTYIQKRNIDDAFKYIVMMGKEGIEDLEKFDDTLYPNFISQKFKRKFVIRLYKLFMDKAFTKTKEI